MKSLKNFINEAKNFADYSNNELQAYYDNTKDKAAEKELSKRASKIKTLTRTD